MEHTAHERTWLQRSLAGGKSSWRFPVAGFRLFCIASTCIFNAANVGCHSPPPRETGHVGQSFTGVGAELNQQAAAAIDRSDFDEAERLYREALALRRERLGPDHLDVALSLGNLAWVRQWQGQYDEAETLHREALAIRRKQLGDEHPDVARSLTSLGACLTREGRYSEAEQALTQALTILRQVPEPPHPDEFVTLDKLVKLYEGWGRPQQADEYRRQLFPSRRPDHR